MSAPATDQIEPFFFGPAGRQLYGCYHEPHGWPAREQAVLICYPYGQEYLRSHRACHHLAAQAARAGFPVMRFDYSGTGDSADAGPELDLAQWQADLRLAATELRKRSGVEQVVLAGLRLGASLALAAAPRTQGLAGLVLWEPVVDGRGYLAELQARHDETIRRFFVLPKDYRPGAQPTELLGFALGDAMRAAVVGLDLLETPVPRKPVLLVESHAAPELAALAGRLAQGGQLTHAQVPSFTVWVEDVDKGLVPQQVIEAIVAWLEKVFQ